ncbi:MAG: hypothetical protein IJ934_03455 [Acetobacter sp.]|nr:hypothetical protein [Acetobacter sp.]
MAWLQKRFITIEVQSQTKETTKKSQPVVRAQTRQIYTDLCPITHTTSRSIRGSIRVAD